MVSLDVPSRQDCSRQRERGEVLSSSFEPRLNPKRSNVPNERAPRHDRTGRGARWLQANVRQSPLEPRRPLPRHSELPLQRNPHPPQHSFLPTFPPRRTSRATRQGLSPVPVPNVGGAPGVAGADCDPEEGPSSRQATDAVRKPSGARMRNCRRVFITGTQRAVRGCPLVEEAPLARTARKPAPLEPK